jgi:hypothetical protein
VWKKAVIVRAVYWIQNTYDFSSGEKRGRVVEVRSI